MPKQTIEVDESLVPAGFRAAGFGKPRAGQWYEHCGAAHQAFNDFRTDKHLLLEKVEPVRESRWIALHNPASIGWQQRERARQLAGGNKLIRIDLENNKLVAVTLEPLGEEPQ